MIILNKIFEKFPKAKIIVDTNEHNVGEKELWLKLEIPEIGAHFQCGGIEELDKAVMDFMFDSFCNFKHEPNNIGYHDIEKYYED